MQTPKIVIHTYVWSRIRQTWMVHTDSSVYDVFTWDIARFDFLKRYCCKEKKWSYRLDCATYEGLSDRRKARLLYLFSNAFVMNRPFEIYDTMKYVFCIRY